MTRILIVHNQLWAHYKSRLFEAIQQKLQSDYPEAKFLVLQIAEYESMRKGMGNADDIIYDYPYQVLFKGSIDRVPLLSKTRALFSAFRKFRPTVLNITGYFDPAQVALMLYAKALGVKVVISSESSVADHARSAWKERIKGMIIGLADSFFCFGSSSARYLSSLGVAESKIAVKNAAVIDSDLIHQKFEANRNKRPGNSIRFVYVGRLSKEKNLETLIRAFAGIETEGREVHLSLIGTGNELDLLKDLVASEKIGNVRFEGGHPWYKVPELLATNHVLVLPSKSEPWGLVVNEAMECEMPVLVSEKCGCTEDLVQNSKNGFTFNPDSVSDLSERMQYFVDDPGKIIPMGLKSKEIVSGFSPQQAASNMVNCYIRLSTPN